MIFRSLSLLVALAYVVGQFAALPHAHASEPAEHAGVRHIHLTTAHGCHHGDARHHHAPSHQGHTHDEQGWRAVPGHEQGCIHLSDTSVDSTQTKIQQVDLESGESMALVLVGPPIARTAAVVSCDIAPDILRSGCDLCLTLRTFRI